MADFSRDLGDAGWKLESLLVYIEGLCVAYSKPPVRGDYVPCGCCRGAEARGGDTCVGRKHSKGEYAPS